MKTVYLCGPINGCTDEECTDWREAAKLSIKFDTLDPMRRDYRGREEECCEEIVEMDKADIVRSDVILVNYDKPSVGTSMEMLYAWERDKFVITVARLDTPISPWLKYHSTVRLHGFSEAFDLLNKLHDEFT